MTTNLRIGLGVVAGVVVGVLLSAGSQVFGGVYETNVKYFTQGFNAGSTSQLSVDADGDVVTTGTVRVAEFTQGGGIAAITDANGGTYTLTESEMLNNSVFKMTASGAGQEVIALTLPATSTMTSLLPNAGDMREWIIDASSLAAATTTTVTAGTGIDLIAVTTNDDVIDGAEFARLTCWRATSTDVKCITSELVHAD